MLRFQVIFKGKLQAAFEHAQGPIIFGRGQIGTAACARYSLTMEDSNVSREHLFVEEIPGGAVRIKNVGRNPIRLGDGRELTSQESCELSPPVQLRLGSVTEVK